MSLVDSDHITPTNVRQDCHYYQGNGGKPNMKIWQRGKVWGEEEEMICEKCFYIPFYADIKDCPRCGEKLVKRIDE